MRVVSLASSILLLLSSCFPEGNAPREGMHTDSFSTGPVHVVSSEEGVWAENGVSPWQLVEDLRIGRIEGADPYVFGRIRNVFPDSRGRIWVLDVHAFELRLFDREGRFVRSVGGPGEGPGEFGFNPCAFPGPDGEVWVEAGGRWQRFDTAGVLLGTQPTTRTLTCGIRAWLPDGRFLAANMGTFLIHDRTRSGEVVQTDAVSGPPSRDYRPVHWKNSEGRRVITQLLPLTHAPWRYLGPNGFFWITDGDGDYRIRKHSFMGDTLLVMERPYTPIPVPEAIRDSAMESLSIEGYRLEDPSDARKIPHVFPPFDRLHVGVDGTLWVRRRIEGGGTAFDVFAADGRFLGPADVPPDVGRMTIKYVGPENIYATVKDELDVEYVVRLAIQKTRR